MISGMHDKKVVLVTGANGALGQAIVAELMGDYTVVGTYRGERYENLRHLFGESLSEFMYSCELTDDDAVEKTVKKVFDDHGTPWAVINLAGGSLNAMSWKISHEDFTKVINDNLMSTVNVCRHVLPYMRGQSDIGGRIVNTSSVVAFTGAVGAAHYTAAKAAIVGYTKSLALELAPKLITANTLALGYFDRGLINQLTPDFQESIKAKTPLRRFGRTSEIGGILKYLLSEDSLFMTGQTLHLNGGLS